ncbi:MAG TPA: nucleotidyltransferase domain-containing protein [Flavobacteriaceae bacterium]|nr:nucleotidyltransferase domain-containing protein [Flavobacteriaceae bacterium]
MQLSPQQIELIRSYFSNQPVLKIYLFGSYVRGEGHADSDIDLLVELDHSRPIGLAFIKMKLELEKLLSKKVDLISTRGLSKYIRPIIEKEKTLIYARQVGR